MFDPSRFDPAKKIAKAVGGRRQNRPKLNREQRRYKQQEAARQKRRATRAYQRKQREEKQ